MPSLGQPKGVRIARQAFDIFSTPLEIGAASERLEILLSVRQSNIGYIVNGRSITQAAVDLGLRLKGGIETGSSRSTSPCRPVDPGENARSQ